MKRYVIEREIPGVGKLGGEELKQVAVTSNDALAKLPGKVQWVETFVTGDKTSASTSPTTRAWFASTRA